MAGGGPGPSKSGGLTPKDVTSVTTAAFVAIVTNTGAAGIMGIGAIKNTDGANSLTIRETVIDKFGVTTAVITNLAKGLFYLLDPQTAFAALSWPPYTSYKVEVEDSVPASHATFEMHYAGQGAVV